MMKKILIGLLMFLFVIDVSAKDKTFIIEEINHQYYYEEHSTVDFFQEEIKMDELKTYSDTIQIMNNSDSSREVFLLFESKGEDGSYDDLMDYLHLKIYLNDKEVYNDSAETQNLASKHEDLHDFISIGKIKEKDLSTLKIEMNVSEEYKNISDNPEESKTPYEKFDWDEMMKKLPVAKTKEDRKKREVKLVNV